MNDDIDKKLIAAIEELCYRCGKTASGKGFDLVNHDQQTMLMVSELAEFYEAYRQGKGESPDEHCPEFKNKEVELADLAIRLFSFCHGNAYRLGPAILAKMEYNKTRPYKHGKAF